MTPAKHHSEGFLAVVEDAKTRVHEIGIDELVKMTNEGQQFTLVDVREDSEFKAAHAAPAQHIGKGVIERDIEAKIPDKSTTLVLYCGGGYRSALAADSIQRMGYRNVLSLDGGWRAYESSGLPILTD